MQEQDSSHQSKFEDRELKIRRMVAAVDELPADHELSKAVAKRIAYPNIDDRE